MKQKLGLACALLGRPKLLLLDEAGVGVDPISRRELWKMVQELVMQGIAVVWSTAYLEEAELCAEVLLFNEGKLLFAGKPAALAARVQSRSLQIRNIEGNRRQLLARFLRRPEVSDGVIQGRSIRIVPREGTKAPPLESEHAGPMARKVPVAPRLEDSFIDILGGGPGGDSVLAEHLKPLPCCGETVIEARELTSSNHRGNSAGVRGAGAGLLAKTLAQRGSRPGAGGHRWLRTVITALCGFGLLISSICATQQQAFLGVFSFMMPAVLLSGFASSIDNMPQWLQTLNWINPLPHFIAIVKGLFLKDIPLSVVLSNLWPLLVIAAVTLTSANFVFRHRLG